ncbi:MAG: ATP-dependent RNA helicase, partial [Treponema sp.]|nr:ATP-dependent RNA helicase [Treponema sp.]
KIRDEVFEIKTVKGKKEVRLPWEQLKRIREDLPKEQYYKGLKGTIIVNGTCTLLAGEKLSLILSLAPWLDMDGVLERRWAEKNMFNSQCDLEALLKELPKLLCPARWKAGTGSLGFIGLFTDGQGNYRFKCSRGFHTSLNESLASLEALIDELGDDVDIGKKHAVNQAYRRLSDYLGSNRTALG